MSEAQPYYVLKITRPEHPSVFVQELYREGELALFEDTLLPQEAHRYASLQEVMERAQALSRAQRFFHNRLEQLSWAFIRKISTYDPWRRPASITDALNGIENPVAGFEPRDWERAIISRCMIVVMKVAPGARPERIGEPIMVQFTVPETATEPAVFEKK